MLASSPCRGAWTLCSELYEPGNKLKSQSSAPHAINGHPVPDVDMSAQQRKDSWRGKPVSAHLAQGQMLSDTEILAQLCKDSWPSKIVPQPPSVRGHMQLPRQQTVCIVLS